MKLPHCICRGLMQARWRVSSVSECTRLVSNAHRSDSLDSLWNCLPSTTCLPTADRHHHHHHHTALVEWFYSHKLLSFLNELTGPTCFPLSINNNNLNNGLLRWDLSSQRDICSEDCQILASMHSHAAASWFDHTGFAYATGAVIQRASMGRQHREQMGHIVLPHYT